jgi:hypothetical protein
LRSSVPTQVSVGVTQEKVYDSIAHMYSGRDIFSTGCSRHAEFDEKIDQISGHI